MNSWLARAGLLAALCSSIHAGEHRTIKITVEERDYLVKKYSDRTIYVQEKIYEPPFRTTIVDVQNDGTPNHAIKEIPYGFLPTYRTKIIVPLNNEEKKTFKKITEKLTEGTT